MKKFKIAALTAADIIAVMAVTVTVASNNVSSVLHNNTIGLTNMEKEIESILAESNTVFISPQDVESYAAAAPHPDNSIVCKDGLTNMEREIERILAETLVGTATIDTPE